MGVDVTAPRSPRSLLGPAVAAVVFIAVRVALVLAFLAAGYLLLGLLSGQLAQFRALPRPERVRVLANVDLARTVLIASLAVGSLTAAYLWFYEEATGYVMGLAGLLFYLGFPYGFAFFVDPDLFAGNYAARRALMAFPDAARPLLLFGGLLVLRDIGIRLIDGVRNKPVARDRMAYGKNAVEEKRPLRIAVLGKCWEGPYCREFIRTHCPIFHARKACWRVKKGCYCEEDIVTNAASKISGVQLEMAPDPRYNFANAPSPGRAQLTNGQKRERCRHCIIYNEHQRQKYQLLMPIVAVGVLVLAAVFSPVLREGLNFGLAQIESVMVRFSFTPGATKLGRPTDTVAWVLIAAFTVMALSKALQILEWAVFKIKI